MVQSSPGVSHSNTILLVEDNPGDARLVEEVCDEIGISGQLHIVSNGTDALDFVMQRGDYTGAPRPDLIVLDWHLPRMDGKELLQKLTDESAHGHIPVLVTSGSISEREIREIYGEKANALIEKPSGPGELKEIVRTIDEFWLATAKLPTRREHSRK